MIIEKIMDEGYKKAEKRINQAKLNNLIELDLSKLNLTALPESIVELEELQRLNINSNQISDWSFLRHLNRLQTLSLRNNQIFDASFLQSKTGLKKLNLGENHVQDYRFLENMIGLEELYLSGNQITDISFLESLTGLKKLDLSQNRIVDPNLIGCLTRLQSLYLFGSRIPSSSFLGSLINLRKLFLSTTRASDYGCLEKLTKMEILYLGSSKISNTGFLGSLSQLQNLYLPRNEISDLGFLESLNVLKRLNLKNNRISDIRFLESQTGLESLDLRDNQIADITPLARCIKEGLPIAKSYSAKGIGLGGNPISTPPLTVVEKGTQAVLNWFEQVENQGLLPLYEAKMMVLGQGGVGKTTFSKLQVNPGYKVGKGKLGSTLGIEIYKDKVFPHRTIDDIYIKTHLWDFGGQNIQKMLHQFFITENCLYVLVSDKRRENANFDYWFQIINLLGPKSSVIVLENEMDAEGNNENFALNIYRDLFPDLDISSCEVNLALITKEQKANWELLNMTLSKKLSDLEIVNREVPKNWTLVRDELGHLKVKKYITTTAFFELCKKAEIGLSEEQADLCLFYLNSLGDLFHFNEGELKTYIFLDHKWLTKGLYYILADEAIKEQQGRFTRAQAYKKWGKKYKKPEKDMLLLLLLKDQFDLCYELKEEKDVFITPLLLPNDQPEKWSYETDLHFQYNYGFMPHGIFPRAIVRVHEKIDDNQLWQTGVRLLDKETGARAEVQQFNDPDDNRQVIDIKIHGDKTSCRVMLEFIRSNIESLHREFKNLNAKTMVGCNCASCTRQMNLKKKPSFYSYDDLVSMVENKVYEIYCRNHQRMVSIGLVLNDVVAEDAGEKHWDRRMINELKEIGMTVDKSDRSIHMSDFGKAYSSSNSDSKSDSEANAKAEATAKAKVNIEIQSLRGDTEVLKEDIERELKIKNIPEEEIALAVSDVEAAESALEQIENAESIEAVPAKSKSRLRRFINSLSNPDSTMHKTLKMLREGKDHGVQLAETYNKIASNFAMPLVPPAALEIIKKI